ncbi:MAG TPA: histidine triad nucleotide-binding protein [Armatimonadota bacterium]|nr:histidine triad nucleotide-binding protein [Armatimonadota bacterium]
MSQDCLFCRIANGELPVELLYQDDAIAAFRDINPVAPTHILIVPRKHIQDVLHLTESDAALLAKIYAVAADLAHREGIDEKGFRIVTNTGADAGQTVQHIHFHVIGGRQLAWPPG